MEKNLDIEDIESSWENVFSKEKRHSTEVQWDHIFGDIGFEGSFSDALEQSESTRKFLDADEGGSWESLGSNEDFNFSSNADGSDFIDDKYAFKKHGLVILEFDTEEELFQFSYLYNSIRSCYMKSNIMQLGKLQKSLAFCFDLNQVIKINDDLITDFDGICNKLFIHPDLVRIRLMYELYNSKVIINYHAIDKNRKFVNKESGKYEYLQFKMNPLLPAFIKQELMFDYDRNKTAIAQELYKWPSIIKSDFVKKIIFFVPTIEKYLNEMINIGQIGSIEANINGRKEEYLYFIGKNPSLLKNRRFKWHTAWLID
jgi:hypothetical protein